MSFYEFRLTVEPVTLSDNRAGWRVRVDDGDIPADITGPSLDAALGAAAGWVASAARGVE